MDGWEGSQITADGEAVGSVRASITYPFLRSCAADARRPVTDARGHVVKGKDFIYGTSGSQSLLSVGSWCLRV